jgi:tRNA modification GTPase
MDTIFALASARGKAGVAVVRLSGPLAHDAVLSLCSGPLPRARQASLRELVKDDVLIDEALVLTFDHGASFTGEQAAEFQIHGSVATIGALLSALGSLPGLRLAEAGEFTRRALENGRLDLAQVEGLADLIDAETEAQRKLALRVLSGEIGRRTEAWRADLIRAAALVEATIDFADEDVPLDVTPEVALLIRRVTADLRRQVDGATAAERIRDGFEVAIVGRPNAGKSTLLNALAGRDAAITSPVPGTTRDVIEVRMDIGGLAVTLLDTAGLRDTDDVLERMGVDRARARAAAADLRIFLLDDSGRIDDMEPLAGDIVVQGKSDLGGTGISGLTGDGVDDLLAVLGDRLSAEASGASLVIRHRHREAIKAAVGALEVALIEVEGEWVRAEIVAADLRRALWSLDSLVGRVGVEDLLGEIFSSFCIGK